MSLPVSPHHPIHSGDIVLVTGTLAVDTGQREVQSFSVTAAQDQSINFLGVSATLGSDKKTLTLKAWKPTSNSNPTPIAATAAVLVSWQALGK